MIGLKITSNNVKLIKLWFFIKFLNFSKKSEILTQVKASYIRKLHINFQKNFGNSIKNYKIFLT
jgi:hypothetical protein